jgi:hypothetical protein
MTAEPLFSSIGKTTPPKTQPARRPFRNHRAGYAWVERETLSDAFRKIRPNFHANCRRNFHRNFHRGIRLRYIRRHSIVEVADCSSAAMEQAEDCNSADLARDCSSDDSALGCKSDGLVLDFRYTRDAKARDSRYKSDAVAPDDCIGRRQLPACAYPMEACHSHFPDIHFPDTEAAMALDDPPCSDWSCGPAELVVANSDRKDSATADSPAR